MSNVLASNEVYLLTNSRGQGYFYIDRSEALSDFKEMSEVKPETKWYLFKSEVKWKGAVDTQLTLW
jgi:hypothetical protein